MDLWFSENTSDGHKISLRVKESLFVGKSPYQDVAILDTEDFGRILLLDGLFQTTERDEFIYHELIAHVPLMAHPEPKRVLVVGGGDGGTVREVLRHPSVEHVTLCEIDGMVVEQSKKWLPTIACKLDDPRVTVRIEDAIAFVATQEAAFDAILIDSSDPVGPGEGLFTREFYTNARRALKPGGVLCVQTESPIAMVESMTRAYKALYAVFPRVESFLGTIPTYPGHLWSWAFCTDGFGPNDRLREGDFEALEAETKYYNRHVHQGAFAVPNFVQKILDGSRELARV